MEPEKYTKNVKFSLDDLDLFSQASHDKNPLHLSEDYARKTPFAKRVVFGILGGLYGLAHLRDRPNLQLKKITFEFASPLFTDLEYSLEITEHYPSKALIRIYDGRRLMSKATAYFEIGQATKVKNVKPKSEHKEAILVDSNKIREGHQLKGNYCPDSEALRVLSNHLKLIDKGIDDLAILTLLWSSYFVGMEFPGRQALFSKLSLNFEEPLDKLDKPVSYMASVCKFDSRYYLTRTSFKLTASTITFASGEIQAFIRPNSTNATANSIEALMPRSNELRGKVALITGASRGLGAAIAQSLALQGCTVLVNFLNSLAEAEKLRAAMADAPGKIVLMQGDASNLSWCLSAKEEIISHYGQLDFLVCNACPAILPLWIESVAIDRVNDYIAKSLALMSVPLAAFLEVLANCSGSAIIISSTVATQSSPTNWPHYTSAKYAIEGLTKVAAAEYEDVKFVIVRPPKLLTDQTNTPLGRQGAVSVEKVASSIVQHLKKTLENSHIDILENIWQPDEKPL